MKRVFIIFAILLAAGGATVAQWGSRGCSPAGPQLWAPSAAFARQPDFLAQPVQAQSDWRFHPGDPMIAYLYRNGVQVGGYNYAGGYWRDYDAATDTWGPMVPCTRDDAPNHIGKSIKDGKRVDAKPTGVVQPKAESEPLPLPFGQLDREPIAAEKLDLTDPLNMGVQWNKIEDHGITYEGRRISCDKAATMIQNEIPDHKKKLRVNVIGTESECKPVRDQLVSLEPEISSRILIRCMPPGDWATKDGVTGQVVYKDGHPSLYVQAPDGKVLHRQSDDKQCVDAIRKTVKKYDADKDPDLRKPQPMPGPLPNNPNNPATPMHPAIPVAIGIGLLMLFAKGKSNP